MGYLGELKEPVRTGKADLTDQSDIFDPSERTWIDNPAIFSTAIYVLFGGACLGLVGALCWRWFGGVLGLH